MLQLTESSTLPDDRRTVDVLRGLKDLGLHLWLNDFGSGYSSLHYLRVFPIDAVKIEPGFAARLPQDRASRLIIGSVIDLSHALGMKVIVEGIETAEELRAAQDLGADHGQGFHLGRYRRDRPGLELAPASQNLERPRSTRVPDGHDDFHGPRSPI